MLKAFYLYIIFFLHLSVLMAGEPYLHHELEIMVMPNEQSLNVVDNVRIPEHMVHAETYFLLHGNLNISHTSQNIRIEKIKAEITPDLFGIKDEKLNLPDNIPLNLYRISLVNGNEKSLEISISYEGKIHHPIDEISKEYARGFSETPGIISEEGVYLAVSGPSFETPAEIRMMRVLGADMVGMSTIPEVIMANSLKIRVLGLSMMTNMAAGITGEPLTHQEVIETTQSAAERFKTLVGGIIKRMVIVER